MIQFVFSTAQEIAGYLNTRAGEQKIGETISIVRDVDELSVVKAKFVVLGIPEDIGVRANGGLGGTFSAWPAFLKSFLNIQETPFLRGEHMVLLGHFDTAQLQQTQHIADMATLRSATENIDDVVFPIIEKIVQCGKIPIVIGGGHNNAYPLLKGTSRGLGTSINAINLDAHADFRALEGRHSGNGFHYAYQEQYLKKYAVVGWHEAYNNETMLHLFKSNPDLHFVSFENIFLRQKIRFPQAIDECLQHVNHQPFGVELDLDSITDTLSSAATPIGISTIEALQYLFACAQSKNAVYLHLPEGAAERADGKKDCNMGKLLSYLVQAFMKGVLER